jgi:hypothetical protein
MKKSSLTLVALASLTAPQYATEFELGDIFLRVCLASVAANDSSSNIMGGEDLGVNVALDSI